MAETTMRTLAFIARRGMDGKIIKSGDVMAKGSEARIDAETGLIRFFFQYSDFEAEVRYHLRDIESYWLVEIPFDEFSDQSKARMDSIAKQVFNL